MNSCATQPYNFIAQGNGGAVDDFITVNDKDDIRVTFHNGMEIRV